MKSALPFARATATIVLVIGILTCVVAVVIFMKSVIESNWSDTAFSAIMLLFSVAFVIAWVRSHRALYRTKLKTLY